MVWELSNHILFLGLIVLENLRIETETDPGMSFTKLYMDTTNNGILHLFLHYLLIVNLTVLAVQHFQVR